MDMVMDSFKGWWMGERVAVGGRSCEKDIVRELDSERHWRGKTALRRPCCGLIGDALRRARACDCSFFNSKKGLPKKDSAHANVRSPE
ncbi:hypothetical protein H9K76_04455 [Diaphorobacter ruginosibacter]|uniref:Uncharacterized protein n=1 Tax=Diaphorobacter ruginosibacter TaxID=1715720 RepID=A0A7G9RR96_9BURK|nr:hypothetical protein [Diaphorobacter ruginosibacter]QNN58121.1 hypothetical protein H9K76_04455 [Diaphorobacter ruginosibacter]